PPPARSTARSSRSATLSQAQGSTTFPAPRSAPAAGPGASSSVRAASPAPTTLNDLAAWLDYRARNHIAALPEDARIFYRRGLLLHQSGGSSEAVRLVRGATELDPD